VAEPRPRGVRAFDRDVLGLEDDGGALGLASLEEVPSELGLTVDGDPSAGVPREIDPQAPAGERDLHPVVHETLPIHSRADPGPPQDLDGALLEHARPDAPEDMVAGPPLARRSRCRADAAAGRAGAPTAPRR